MRSLRRFGVLAFMLSMKCGPAAADSMSADLAKLPTEADIVALVEIVSGELVFDAQGMACGASYRARVERALKGTINGALVTFGRYGGYGIGKNYFAFLKTKSRKAPPSLQYTFSSPYSVRPECLAVTPSLEVMSEGLGLIAVEPGNLVKYRPAVSLSSSPYLIPETIKSTRKPGGQVHDGYFYGSAQVEVGDFYDFIQSKLSEEKEESD
jgi:hypothetical protein